MQYECKHCGRSFCFNDEIGFCPYCGNAFTEEIANINTIGERNDLAQTIDSIWGENARIRREFSDIVSDCIFLINNFAEECLESVLPKQDISKFEKNYAAIKQSNNRKTLISRVDGFLDSLETVIENISDGSCGNSLRETETVFFEVEDMIKELYGFLGARYTSRQNLVDSSGCSAEVVYTRDKLMDLYNSVLIAYSKYKKCVADNNMFAAFASTSDYGVMDDYWRRWLKNLSKRDEEDEKSELPKIDEVIDFMKQQNAIKYFGLLDEDFVPHVDAFWYGLEMLCEFIDNHVVVDYPQINSDTRNKLLKNIASTSFEVTESRLEALYDLKHRFEEQTVNDITV